MLYAEQRFRSSVAARKVRAHPPHGVFLVLHGRCLVLRTIENAPSLARLARAHLQAIGTSAYQLFFLARSRLRDSM